jgi:hypothetical protein
LTLRLLLRRFVIDHGNPQGLAPNQTQMHPIRLASGRKRAGAVAAAKGAPAPLRPTALAGLALIVAMSARLDIAD